VFEVQSVQKQLCCYLVRVTPMDGSQLSADAHRSKQPTLSMNRRRLAQPTGAVDSDAPLHARRILRRRSDAAAAAAAAAAVAASVPGCSAPLGRSTFTQRLALIANDNLLAGYVRLGGRKCPIAQNW